MGNPEWTREHVERIAKDGYTLLPRVIEPALVDELADSLLRLEREHDIRPAKNGFEGHRTVRIYNLLALARVFERVPVHAALLPIVEGVIGEGCLISSLSSIAIDPGEIAQPIHADDQLIPLQKPHAPIICNSMWALTDFTEANGATRLVPGTHLRENPDFGGTYATIAAEMPRGSLLIWNGALWHGGGANNTAVRRTGIAMNYCAGFIRQQENQQLGIPREIAARFEPKLQELCGYGVYRGLIGHIDKHSPQEMLAAGVAFRSVWEQT